MYACQILYFLLSHTLYKMYRHMKLMNAGSITYLFKHFETVFKS